MKNDGIDLSKVFERDSKSGRYFLKKYDDVKNSFSDGEEKVFLIHCILLAEWRALEVM